MTTVQEVTWPAGAYRWLDSEFAPASAQAAEASIAAATADAWAGYAPVGWPANPWTGEQFRLILEAGARPIILAVGPLAPTGGAWSLGATLAQGLHAFAEREGLAGKALLGIDAEAELWDKNSGFASDMVGEFLATMTKLGTPAGAYGPWALLADVESRWPGALDFAWGTGNSAGFEDLAAQKAGKEGRRADQFAWDIGVAGINCDLSIAQFGGVASDTAPATIAPTETAPATIAPTETAPVTTAPTETAPAYPVHTDSAPADPIALIVERVIPWIGRHLEELKALLGDL